MPNKTVCLLGGTGFVGSHLAQFLVSHGYRVRIPTRRRERHKSLLVLPTVDLVEADISEEKTLQRLFRDCDAVLNLVAVLNQSRRDTFQNVHVELPRKVVHACRSAGVEQLLHMSALGADPNTGPSAYLRSKGQGEDLVHEARGDDLRVTSFRPSVIFGPNDHLYNRFATLLKLAPGVFPLASPKTRFAPVFVGDVAHAFITALETRASQRYELCGPNVYTLEQMVEYVNRLLKLNRAIVPLGDGASALLSRLLGMVPGKPLTYDNYLSLKQDNLCSGRMPSLLPENPLAPEAVVPYYLGRNNQRAHYDTYRRQARHGS